MKSSIRAFLAENTNWILSALVLITIITLFLTLLPSHKLPHLKVFAYDKVGHFLMFGSWTFLLGAYLSLADYPINWWVVFLIGVCFGVGIELLQGLPVVNRDPDVFDALADSCGCLVAVLLLRWLVIE